MGVIIDTATKKTDKFGAGIHGFTSGNPQAGIAPTQFSSDWADGTQQEINNAIADEGSNTYPLTNVDRHQLAKTMQLIGAQRRPRPQFSGPFTFRAHSGNATSEAWYRWEHSDAVVAKASGTVWQGCSFTMPGGSAVFQVEYKTCVIETASNTNRGTSWLYASGSYTAGVINYDENVAIKENIPLANLTISIGNLNFNIMGLSVSLPAIPAAKTYNIHTTATFTFVLR
jgi:hypothetical protein